MKEKKLTDEEFNFEALRKEKNEYFDKAIELQKQVDELTDKLGKVLSGIKADEVLIAKGVEQAVKDEIKEILQELTCILRKCEVKVNKDNYEQFGFIYMVDSSDIDMCLDGFAKRYGVEVE